MQTQERGKVRGKIIFIVSILILTVLVAQTEFSRRSYLTQPLAVEMTVSRAGLSPQTMSVSEGTKLIITFRSLDEEYNLVVTGYEGNILVPAGGSVTIEYPTSKAGNVFVASLRQSITHGQIVVRSFGQLEAGGHQH